MRRSTSRLVFTLATALWLTCAAGVADAGPFTFGVAPGDGSIDGAPGATIGWGYTIINPSLTEWLVLTALSADVFEFATPNAGLFDSPILAPGTALTIDYLAGSMGLFELTWDATAPAGFVNAGTFVVSGEWWSADPFDGGQILGTATDQSASYTASVTPSPVPEPSSLVLLATGLAGFWRCLRRAPRQRS
jgi:hypothetical protein